MTLDHEAILCTYFHSQKRKQIEYLHNGVESIFKSEKNWKTAPSVFKEIHEYFKKF